MRPSPNDNELSFSSGEIIVSKTDTKGKITYGNRLFIELSKYDESDLIGKPHSTIRHPDMPRTIFWLLWDRIQGGNEIYAYVKNLSADGSYYWVLANVTPSFDPKGSIIGYYSVRRKPKKEVLEGEIIPLYKKLVEIESSSGLDKAKVFIDDMLKNKGVSYDEFILSL
jgi:PAS domain S-box-containing protein